MKEILFQALHFFNAGGFCRFQTTKQCSKTKHYHIYLFIWYKSLESNGFKYKLFFNYIYKKELQKIQIALQIKMLS